MPKTVLEFLEEGRKCLFIDESEIPEHIDDADASNALVAAKLFDEQLASVPVPKAARLYAYDCVIAKLKAGLAEQASPVSNDGVSGNK